MSACICFLIAFLVNIFSLWKVLCFSPLFFQFKKRLEGNTRPFTSFKESKLLDVFKSFGFVRTERYPEFFLPMVLHRVLKSAKFSSAAERLCRQFGMTNLLGSPVILKVVRTGE